VDQLQFDPGSTPEASTSDTNAATEAAVEGAATTTTAGAAGVMGAGGTVTGGEGVGGVTADVDVVVTGATAEVVVVAVVW
jgi:hypothetical protein